MNETQLIASVTLVLPNRKVGKQIVRGGVLKAGAVLDTSRVPDTWIEEAIEAGLLYVKAAPLALKDVAALRRDEELNVSSTENRAGQEDNPLDDGIDLAATGGDPALEGKLAEIQAEQAEAGVEHPADGPERTVEVNAETGEIEVQGEDPDFDDEEDADSQVS
jgi:hypothetical protein